MDVFETIAAKYMEDKGYWVRRGVKIDISKADKRKIGLPSMPRPEIDLVAYKADINELVMIEVKSFLYSPGVRYKDVVGTSINADRYRLLNNKTFQEVVSGRLVEYFVDKGLSKKTVKLKYGLVAGNIYPNDREAIKQHFDQNEWMLVNPEEIKDWIKRWVKEGWEDDPILLTAKLVL